MKARIKPFVAGVFVVFIAMASLAITVAAQTGSGKLNWTLRLNETRGPIRTAEVSTPSGKTAVSEILGGPASGSDNAYLIYTRMPSGARGPGLFTLPVDHYYVVVSGKMTVQIGTDEFVAGPLTGVVIPANTPHEVRNADAEPEAHLEVIASANPSRDLSRDLMSMLKPAQPKKVENAAQYIREIKVPPASDLKPGLNRQAYTNRSMGSPITVALDSTSPGSGGPKPHVHRFEQVYFMLDGETTVTYGIDNPKAKKNDVVILPIGVVHTNTNQSTAIERHITLLLPEPEKQPFDIEFEMKGPAGSNAGGGPGPTR
jgi:mannose-6-phosphate isomerase-like protein (cupin superfamily)